MRIALNDVNAFLPPNNQLHRADRLGATHHNREGTRAKVAEHLVAVCVDRRWQLQHDEDITPLFGEEVSCLDNHGLCAVLFTAFICKVCADTSKCDPGRQLEAELRVLVRCGEQTTECLTECLADLVLALHVAVDTAANFGQTLEQCGAVVCPEAKCGECATPVAQLLQRTPHGRAEVICFLDANIGKPIREEEGGPHCCFFEMRWVHEGLDGRCRRRSQR
mmetsp:Transcript_14942/g.37886  ORF Transcript_14942/g.37886 Transcript_14942/m.37886 type:complete len:221 (-) Transcript_14942:127-789(-)